jgi:hypothetical protein
VRTLSCIFLGLVAACATSEQSPQLGDPSTDPDFTAGTTGDSAGSFNQGQSGSVGEGGSLNGSGGQVPITGGTFTSQGGFATSGTGFGQSGTEAGGASVGTGGSSAGTASGGSSGTTGSGGKAGAGGTGSAGMPPTGACGDDPLGAKSTWTATASVHADACDTPDDTDPYCGPPIRGIDGVTTNRFSTGTARTGNEWYQIDFGKDVAISKIVLNTAAGNGDYTLAYEVRMSSNANDIAGAAVIKSGMGQKGATTIDLGGVKVGRYLRINQTMALDGWWSLAEVDISCQ